MFLITNRLGGYALLDNSSFSRYGGIFFRENNKVMKVIEDIKVKDKTIRLNSKDYSIIRQSKKSRQTFFMPQGFNCIVYESNNKVDSEILLDVKESYDNREFGRDYEIEEQDGIILITFTKFSDNKEDDSHGQEEYEAFIAIKTKENDFFKSEQFKEVLFNYDKQRGSYPENRFVYSALHLKTKKAVISFSFEKEKAIHDAQFVYDNITPLKKTEKTHNNAIISPKSIKKVSGLTGRALRSSLIALDQLLVKNKRIYAGLPWFFQYWSRDSAICLKGVYLLGKRITSKNILISLLGNLQKDGNISNRNPPTDLGCADAVGWTFFRAAELWKKNIFISSEKKLIEKKLSTSIRLLLKHHTENGFAHNNAQETWMDTVYKGDTREGCRIEIQAMRLFMYRFMYDLSQRQYYKKLELSLKKKVLSNFWNGKILADGLNDWTIRPNIFIAYYIYPQLLSKEEWKKCFKTALKHLWLKWGGLSTIEKHHPLYYETYSGEIPDSYHRGDSWFWINNLAAICMTRLNKKTFKHYIDTIKSASIKEILDSGIIGSHAELSSASSLQSQGCPSQAWSLAMFIELITELN